ncbi:MAG: hypothetical protein AB7F96_01645 [Beijerinckiaceae bacterium]
MNRLRIFLLLLALGLAAVLATAIRPGVRVVPPAEEPPKTAARKAPQTATAPAPELKPTQKLAATRRLIDERLAEAAEFAPFFDQFKSNFPAAYERVFDTFADATTKGARIETADLYLAQALRGLRSSHGVLAAAASPERLARVFALQEAILKALAQDDPKLCADFLYGNASRPFFKFSAQHRKLVAEMAEAGMQAIIDGKQKKIERPSPTDAEFSQVEEALRKNGLEKPEIEMLLDARMPEPPLADAGVCKAGQVYFETLRALPEELRMKIYALAVKLLARS